MPERGVCAWCDQHGAYPACGCVPDRTLWLHGPCLDQWHNFLNEYGYPHGQSKMGLHWLRMTPAEREAYRALRALRA